MNREQEAIYIINQLKAEPNSQFMLGKKAQVEFEWTRTKEMLEKINKMIIETTEIKCRDCYYKSIPSLKMDTKYIQKQITDCEKGLEELKR